MPFLSRSIGSRSFRPGRRGVVAAIVSVVILAAAVVITSWVRGRAQGPPYGFTDAAAPSSPGLPPPPATTGAPATSGPGGGNATCDPGPAGPLRLDTQFTAEDGAGTAVHYSISLPADYYSTCRQYPVVYALHGKTQSNVDFLDEALAMRTAMAAGVLETSIIVTPDSYQTGRWENLDTGPAENNVITYLIPYVEQHYRVRPGPSYRLLTGFSMGGHGAIRFGLKYPGMFAAVWSVDGAMAGSQDYLPFVQGKSSGDFRIIAAGGRLNGDRVKRLVDDLARHGVVIPYDHQDLDHEFVHFVREDERLGWPAMRYLQRNLGRTL